MLISFEQLLEGPGRGYSPAALAALAKHSPSVKDPDQGPDPGPGKWVSAGCFIVPSLTAEGLGKTYLRAPKGTGYGNPWTFGKGRVDPGESFQQTARREVLEEMGITVSLLPGGHLGSYPGSYNLTHIFMAVQASAIIRPHDAETKEVKLVTLAEAGSMLSGARDTKILADAVAWITAFKKKHGL